MSSTPTAKLADGRLILNLPDAETPALWVMDLNDAQTSVIRMEADKAGLYVLKKHGPKGAETIAVYSNRDNGARALQVAAKGLEKARRPGAAGGACPASRAGRVFTYFIMAWFFIWSLGLVPYVMGIVLSPFMSHNKTVSTPQAAAPAAQAQQQPQTAPADATGVPLSADDFLIQKMTPSNPDQAQ